MHGSDGAVRKNIEGRAAEVIASDAAKVVRRTIRAGAENYERKRDLPKLARLDPAELATDSVEATELIVSRLRCALRAERNRARSGHWTYDLNRHIALRQAYLAESEWLDAIKRRAKSPR